MRPGDGEGGIVISVPAGVTGDIGAAHAVEHIGIGDEGEKSVSATFGDEELVDLVRRKLCAKPLPEGRALGPQIDDDVEDRASRHLDQLSLGKRLVLEMHAAQGVGLVVVGKIALCECKIDTRGGEFVRAIGSREKPPVVAPRFGLDQETAWDSGLVENHGVILMWGTAVTNKLPLGINGRVCSITSSAMFQGRITR